MMPTRRFDRLRDVVGNRMAEQDRGAREHEQRQRMAKAPGQAVLDDVGDMGAARGDAGYGGDVIGLQRMLHAEQKTKSQNSEHPLRPVVRRLWHSVGALSRRGRQSLFAQRIVSHGFDATSAEIREPLRQE